MRVLVTGGLGFIGSNFIQYYHRKYPNDRIINLDKKTYAASTLALQALKRLPNYELVVGDICSTTLVSKLMSKVDAVVHFAAESHVDNSILNPFPSATTNIMGTLTLLKAASQSEVSIFHHVSTDEVFGSLPINSPEKFSEESCYDPRNPYSASKASSDFYVKMFHSTYGLHTIITNSSNNFGPFQNKEKLIPKAILNILSDKPVPIYGDGKNVRDWLYVEDHCSAIDLCMKKGKPGESYCISASNEYSNLEIVELITEELRRPETDLKKFVRFVEDRKGHDLRYALDAKKIRRLGWRPKSQFHESLSRTVEWYKRCAREISC